MQSREADHAASHLGKAVGISTLLRGAAFHASQRRSYMPIDLCAKHGVSQVGWLGMGCLDANALCLCWGGCWPRGWPVGGTEEAASWCQAAAVVLSLEPKPSIPVTASAGLAEPH